MLRRCLLQALQLQPENIRGLYRLAQAQFCLQLFADCVHSCSAALLFRPAAAQLQSLLQRAQHALRSDFLVARHREISEAQNQAESKAAQQVRAFSISQVCLDFFQHLWLHSKHLPQAFRACHEHEVMLSGVTG